MRPAASLSREVKRRHMEQLAQYRESLYLRPQLKSLFLELTTRCNERCLHCGSSCGDIVREELTLEQYREFLTKIKRDFGTDHPRICLTGGEPLMRPDFFEIAGMIHELGFRWGMTSNATLIDERAAELLEQTGMRTISVSLDGLRESHDSFRRTPGGWDKAMRGIQNLIDCRTFGEIQITTVVHKGNIGELEELYQLLLDVDIDSWRVINIDPIGRAKQHPELLLDADDYRRMFDFINNKRKTGMPLLYGCEHYLGADYEREVRDWYFLCNAGRYTAGIRSNGDIGACLDIEPRPELIEGNILQDDFTELWKNGFRPYRCDLADSDKKCRECPERRFCAGGAFHSFDFDNMDQQVCFKGILF